MAMATVSVAAPVRATAGSKAAKPAFMGRAAAGSKASLSDAFCAMSLATPARKQANRSLSICGEYAFGATAVSERSGRRYPDREGTALFSGIGNPTPCSAVEPRGTGGEEREWDGWTSMDRVESTAHARASNHHDAVVPPLPFLSVSCITVRRASPPPPGAPHPFLIHFTSPVLTFSSQTRQPQPLPPPP